MKIPDITIGHKIASSLQKTTQQTVQEASNAINSQKCLEGLNILGSYNKGLAKQDSLIENSAAEVYGDIMSDETFEKAKNMVMQTILDADAKESLVLVQNNGIMKYILGKAESVDIDDSIRAILQNPKNKIVVIHSHPNYKDASIGTTPVSFGDYKTLNSSLGCQSIFAINSIGEYSALKKLKKPLTPDEINKLQAEYRARLHFYENGMDLNFAPPILKKYLILQKQYEKALDEPNGPPQSLVKKIMEFTDQITQQDWDEYYHKENIAEINGVHQFWKDYAAKANVEYFTNYSNLK